MYIGNHRRGSGLHHLIYEVVDNSIDEALAGHCDTINVIIHEDNGVTGWTTAAVFRWTCTPRNMSALELVMTTLHARAASSTIPPTRCQVACTGSA